MPRRNFNNEAYRARQARRRRQAIQEAQRRTIQALYRNEQIPTINRPQEAILLLGNETVRRATAEYYQPPIAIPMAAGALLTQDYDGTNLPIAINPRQAHERYMRALGLNPNFRPSN